VSNSYFVATAIGPGGGCSYRRGRDEALAELHRAGEPTPVVRATGYLDDGVPHLLLEAFSHPERRVFYDGPLAECLHEPED